MESYAGYRGTSPPSLLVSFNRDEVDVESGAFSKYQDPLDLKNTFLSWDYSFDSTNNGLGKLVMINPSVAIEDKLFSWYAALSPRSWTSQARALPIEELEAQVKEVADFYVRWGYQSIPNLGVHSASTGFADVNALSHIHKFRLLDMGYQISDKGDKIITLTLINLWELYYANPDFVEKERLFEFSLAGPGNKLKLPSVLMQEVLLQLLAAHDTYLGYSKWTDDQFEVLNADFADTVNAKLPSSSVRENLFLSTPGSPDEPHPRTYNVVLPSRDLEVSSYAERYGTKKALEKTSLITIGAARDYYHQFGLDINLVVDEDLDPASQAPSPNQGVGAPNQGTPNDPTTASVQAAENAVAAADGYTEEVTFLDPTRVDNNPSVVIMTGMPAPMAGYTLVHRDINGVAKTQLTSAQLKTILNDNKYFYAVNPAYHENNRVQDKPFPEAALYLAWSEAYPDPGTTTSVGNEMGLLSYPIDPNDTTDVVVISIKSALQALEARKQEKVDELNDLHKINSQVAQLPPSYAKQKALAAVPVKNHTLQFVSDNLMTDLSRMIERLNDKYFKGTSRYLQTGKLEFAHVPAKDRGSVEVAMGTLFEGSGPTVPDWEKDDGVLIITDSDAMSDIFKFSNSKGSIKSFPIQSKTNPQAISLATGFNNRKDNIITSLNWRLNQGSIFNEIRQTPVVVQKLYNVAKRFEDSDYQDVVIGTLGMQLHEGQVAPGAGSTATSTNSITSTGPYDTGLGISVQGIENQEDVVSKQAFPKEAVDKALAQSVTLTTFKKSAQDSGGNNPTAKAELVAQVAEDLSFILNNNLTNIFFPQVSPDTQDRILLRMTGENPNGEPNKLSSSTSYFQYVTKSPISVLQKTLEEVGTVLNDPVNAILLQAKIQSLNIFKKLITDINLEILGVPEMDIWTNEIQNRSVALWVHEPRDPGTYHWITGMYTISSFGHKIDINGYKTTLTLIPKLPNTKEEMQKYTILQVGGED